MNAAEEVARLQGMLAAGAGAQAELASRLAEHPDPTVRLLAEMWSRRGEGAADEEEPPAPPPLAVEALDLDELGLPGMPDAPALRRRVARLELELERLQEINDILAAALGACEFCWGDDPECEICHGRGGPGSRRPDRDLFERLVTPALRRLRGSHPEAAGRASPPFLPSADQATTTVERREG